MSAPASAWSHLSIRLGGSTFKYTETIYKVNHEVAVKRIILRVGDAAGSYVTADVTSLLQDVVHLKPDGSLIVFQEGFGG